MTDAPDIAAEARQRLMGIAAKLCQRTGDHLLVADLFFEVAVATALTAVSPAVLADVFRKRADDIAALGAGAHFDA
jgi:hypothetical protein